jgi:uncharacterized protein YkwD
MRALILLSALVGCSGGSGSTNGTNGTISNPAVQHNLDVINDYRQQNGAPAVSVTDALNSFATIGSEQLAAGGAAHGHFQAAGDDGSLWKSGFCNGAGENQAPGWPITNGDQNATIDAIMKAMMDEGPGGGHHDNIINPEFRLVGIGLVVKGTSLYFTNDFSNACP